MKRMLIICIVLVLVCATAPGPHALYGQQVTRSFFQGEWKLVGGVPPRVDSPLEMPLLLQARETHLYVVDYGDGSVKALDWNGRLVWRFGRRGSGPSEFRNPTDLQIDELGHVWVTDPMNTRVTVIDGEGRLVRHIRPPAGAIRAVPTRGEELLALSPTHTYRLDYDGKVLETAPGLDPSGQLHPLVLEFAVTPAPGDGSAVVGFRYSDQFLMLSSAGGRTSARTLRGVETLDHAEVIRWTSPAGHRITRIDPQATEGHLAMSTLGGTLYSLFGGRSEQAGRILDSY